MHLPDVLVLLVYAAALAWLGVRATRRGASADELALARRSMPMWAVLFSMVATELSAATFIGVPQAAFVGDWTFLQLAFGALAAKMVIGRFLIPLYHEKRLTTVYELLAERFDARTQRTVAVAFVCGRILASGARLFIAAQAVVVLAGVSTETAIALTGFVAALYTVGGGIRAVIQTDVLQGATFVIALIALLGAIGWQLDFEFNDLLAWTRVGERARVFQSTPILSLSDARALGTAVIGGFALTLATHATDQDMVQRLLTTKDGRSGGLALVGSGWLNFPLTASFLAVGTGLAFIAHTGGIPEMGAGERIVPTFARDFLPTGLRGLVFAGLLAAAMSSLDSAICALGTTWVSDVRPPTGTHRPEVALRRANFVFAALLVVTAWAMSAYWEYLQKAPAAAARLDLVQFALSAMSILYGGILGVFVLAWWVPSRGSSTSVLAGLAAGAVVGAALFLQPVILGETWIAWPWWIPFAAVITIAIGASRPSTTSSTNKV